MHPVQPGAQRAEPGQVLRMPLRQPEPDLLCDSGLLLWLGLIRAVEAGGSTPLGDALSGCAGHVVALHKGCLKADIEHQGLPSWSAAGGGRRGINPPCVSVGMSATQSRRRRPGASRGVCSGKVALRAPRHQTGISQGWSALPKHGEARASAGWAAEGCAVACMRGQWRCRSHAGTLQQGASVA